MTTVNTNIASLRAQEALSVNGRFLQKTLDHLSTGKRITSADDDAAGIAIVSSMTAQVKSLNQQIRNANDGISLLQTADGSTAQVIQMLQRMRELVTQALNGTYSDDDITNMGSEVDAIKTEMNRIATDTKWNNVVLLDGNFSDVNLQVSDSSQNVISISIDDLQTSAMDGIDDIDFSNPADITSDWLDSIDGAITTVSSARSNIGATINRLNYTIDNLTTASVNVSASKSRIEDLDYSQATSDLSRAQIIQQAATAMLAQANQQPQLVLSLLK